MLLNVERPNEKMIIENYFLRIKIHFPLQKGNYFYIFHKCILANSLKQTYVQKSLFFI